MAARQSNSTSSKKAAAQAAKSVAASTPARISVEDKRPGRGEQVAARAYEKFLARGGDHGHDFEDWVAAEAELDAEEHSASGDDQAGQSGTSALEDLSVARLA